MNMLYFLKIEVVSNLEKFQIQYKVYFNPEPFETKCFFYSLTGRLVCIFYNVILIHIYNKIVKF